MGYASKNYRQTALYRHHPEMIERLTSLGPGESTAFQSLTYEEAKRLRHRFYSFVKLFYGVQRFIITINKDTCDVIVRFPG